MPQSMPGNISKGHILEALDRYLSTTPLSGLGDTLERLQAELSVESDLPADSLTAIGEARLSLSATDVEHMNDHWFDLREPDPSRPKLWWRDHQPIEPIIRYGLLDLVEEILARAERGQDRLPVDSYWICAGRHCEFVYTIGKSWPPDPLTGVPKARDHQINVLIMTPTPPFSRRHRPPPGYRFGGLDDIFVTRSCNRDMGMASKRGAEGKKRRNLVQVLQPHKVVPE